MTIYGDVTLDTINAMFVCAATLVALAQMLLLTHPS